jgi:AcrR family transcriptional regulator
VDSVKSAPARRPYRSPQREAGARRTRRAVVAAATELFAEHGFAATSLAQISAAAGVARPTVFAAFGSKAGLLRQVLEQSLAGDDELIPVAERPWFRPVWEATTQPAVLDSYAQVCVRIGSRAGRMFEVVRRATDDSPDMTLLWDILQTNRRAGAGMVVEQILSLGRLPSGVDQGRATDVVWMFNDPAHYETLVRKCGWTEASYSAWLAGQLKQGLLTAPGSGSGR